MDNGALLEMFFTAYMKNEIGIVTEMQFVVDEKIFYYQFNQKEYLEKIFYYDNGVEEIFFDRQTAIEEAKDDYYKNRDVNSEAG